MAFRRPRRPTALNLCPGRQAVGLQKSGPPSPLADNRKSSGPQRCLVYGASWSRLPGALNQGQDGKYQQKPNCGKEAVALNRTPSSTLQPSTPPPPTPTFSLLSRKEDTVLTTVWSLHAILKNRPESLETIYIIVFLTGWKSQFDVFPQLSQEERPPAEVESVVSRKA